MKREIKFRAWDEDAEEMIYSDKETDGWWEIHPFRYGYISGMRGGNQFEPPEPDVTYIDGDNIMQFAGLKDKNDREIYEGDIIAYTHYECAPLNDEITEKIAVEWVNNGFRPFNYLNDSAKVEGIGNIYENPELIK